jgi:molybdopterin/thiamine biosynthesis adenylyltransferase/rhodanese-related sulfurtransferase
MIEDEEHAEQERMASLTDRECSIDEAKELVRDNDRLILLDIRSNREICLGYIKGARFVPLGVIESEMNHLSGDKDVPILVYCSSGARSMDAADMLRKMGYNKARSIAGGYGAWLNKGCEIVTDSKLTVHQLNRYSRNMLLKEIGEEGQVKLMNGKVLIVGAGGLASSAALYLAAAGVGTMGIVDFDHVDLSNLNRQVIHRTDDVGRLKVDSAKAAIERMNPDVKVNSIAGRLTPQNALEIIDGYDVVMDATDNIDTKFLLNDACWFANKPYVYGGAVGFDGQAGVFWPKEKGPCLRCLFPKPPPGSLAPT